MYLKTEINIASCYNESFAKLYILKDEKFIFDGLARVQGDVLRRSGSEQVESFLYFNIFDNVWSECIDLLGKACARRTPTPHSSTLTQTQSQDLFVETEFLPNQDNCREQTRKLVDLSSPLVQRTLKIPLPYGLSVTVDISVAGYLNAFANAKLCSSPLLFGQVQMEPKLGFTLIGGTSIDAVVVRAGVAMDARLLDTDINTTGKLSLSRPVSFCANLNVKQEGLQAKFEFWAQARQNLKFCGKIPCGLEWGTPFAKSVDFPGFRRARLDLDIYKSCLEWVMPIRNIAPTEPLVIQKYE